MGDLGDVVSSGIRIILFPPRILLNSHYLVEAVRGKQRHNSSRHLNSPYLTPPILLKLKHRKVYFYKKKSLSGSTLTFSALRRAE